MPLGAGDGYPEKKSRTLFLPEPTRSCHCDLHEVKETILEHIPHNDAHARQVKDSSASYKTLKMSTDAKKLKLFTGDEKEDWKIFYDDSKSGHTAKRRARSTGKGLKRFLQDPQDEC